jgi:hypothetical protein
MKKYEEVYRKDFRLGGIKSGLEPLDFGLRLCQGLFTRRHPVQDQRPKTKTQKNLKQRPVSLLHCQRQSVANREHAQGDTFIAEQFLIEFTNCESVGISGLRIRNAA